MRKMCSCVFTMTIFSLLVAGGCKKSSDAPQADHSRPPAPIPPPSSAAPRAAETRVDVPRPSDAAVAAVVEEMLAAWDKVERVSAKVETNLPEAAGHPGRTDGKGEYWLEKKDGKLLIKFRLFNELKIRAKEATQFMTGEVLDTVIDGNHVYTFLNQPGHREARKKKLSYDDILHVGGPHVFRELVRDYDLSMLPEEMKDNRATKVIKAKPKDNDAKWESIHYFDKASGIRVEMVERDADGKAKLTIKVTQIDTTTPIPPETFKFTVPEGVTFVDETASP